MNGIQKLKVCRICFEKKETCVSLYESFLEKHLPSVIEYCCGVQVSELEEPNAIVCSECAEAMVKAENIIEKFRITNDMLQKTDRSFEEYAEDLIEYVHDNEFDKSSSDCNENSVSLKVTSLEELHSDANDKEDATALTLTRKGVHGVKQRKSRTKYAEDFYFMCDSCSYETSFASYFRKHMIQEHKVEKPRIFKCKICLESYVEHRSLREHIAHVHKSIPREAKFLCSDCGKGFGKHSHLVRHSYVHNPEERPYGCEECSMRFVNLSSARRHMATSHSKIKLYGCKICGKAFNLIYGLKSHLKRMHYNDDTDITTIGILDC